MNNADKKNKKVNQMSMQEAQDKLQLIKEHAGSEYYNHVMLHYKRLLVEKEQTKNR